MLKERLTRGRSSSPPSHSLSTHHHKVRLDGSSSSSSRSTLTTINAPSHLDHTARYLCVSRQRCVGAATKVMNPPEGRSHLARVAVLYSLTRHIMTFSRTKRLEVMD